MCGILGTNKAQPKLFKLSLSILEKRGVDHKGFKQIGSNFLDIQD